MDYDLMDILSIRLPPDNPPIPIVVNRHTPNALRRQRVPETVVPTLACRTPVMRRTRSKRDLPSCKRPTPYLHSSISSATLSTCASMASQSAAASSMACCIPHPIGASIICGTTVNMNARYAGNSIDFIIPSPLTFWLLLETPCEHDGKRTPVPLVYDASPS